MHEVSICESILRTIETELDHNDLENVREIHVKVGILSCVQPDLLKHVFQFVKVDTPFHQAELFAEMVDVLAACEHCGNTFRIEKYKFVCPVCGNPSSNILEGNELKIHKIILEEAVHEEINQ